MSGVEVFLLIAGAAFIIIGNMFAEKRNGSAETSANGTEIWSEKDEVTIKDRVNIVLSDKSEQIIDETDDKLCHLSNDKIMEFQEFADQQLEKLNENHNQTVFMYKMLTDKQNEMKEWIADIDARYAAIKNEFNEYSEMLINLQKNSESKIEITYAAESDKKKPVEEEKQLSEVKDSKEESLKEDITKENLKKTQTEHGVVKKKENNAKKEVKSSKTSNAQSSLISNKNEKILELYDSGKSIVEVSKVLGIGQGEVKLVVGLYRGKK